MNQKEIFEKVANPEGWKLPTIPVSVNSYKEAKVIADAIIYYVGGAVISSVGVNGKVFTVSSKGYYHFIGA